MSVKYSFFDNQVVGVDDLNSITSRLVTEGVARNPSCVSDLNNYVADVATAGVVPESVHSLKVTVKDGIATINKGIAIFADGTTIEVTEAEQMSFLQGEKWGVYAISDSTSNKAFFEISKDEPPYNNKLLIAEINEDSSVTDKRYYARGKLAYYGSADVNNNIRFDADNIDEKITKDNDGYYNYKVNINADMYTCVQIYDKNGINFLRYNFNDGTFISFGHGMGSYYQLNSDIMIVASKPEKRCYCLIEKGEGFVNFRFKMEYLQVHIPLSLRFEFIA